MEGGKVRKEYKTMTTKEQKRLKKDRVLADKIFRKISQDERTAIFRIKSAEAFIGLARKYAKKYKLELPTFFKPLPDEQFPIVKIDLATEQDLLPLLLNKSIFTNYSNLPTKEEIIKQERIRLNKEELDFEEKRAVLTKVGEYRQDIYVVRDYGNHVIGFSCQLYLDYIKASEDKLEDKLEDALKQPHLFLGIVKKIEQGLESVRLYRLAWKIAHVVLTEVYTQRKLRGLVISKERMLRLLGYAPNEKRIYQRIEQALDSLRWCSYKIWGYTFTPGYKKRTDRPSSGSVGTFIYNVSWTPKHYTLSVNENYVGCVYQLLLEDKAPKKERKELFARGYFDWQTRILRLTKDAPISVELLSVFFIKEKGNPKVRRPKIKVITHTVETLAKQAHITHTRTSRRYNDTLSILEQIEIMEKIEPPIHELRQLRPSKGLRTVVHIYVLSSAKELDKLIERKIKEKSTH